MKYLLFSITFFPLLFSSFYCQSKLPDGSCDTKPIPSTFRFKIDSVDAEKLIIGNIIIPTITIKTKKETKRLGKLFHQTFTQDSTVFSAKKFIETVCENEMLKSDKYYYRIQYIEVMKGMNSDLVTLTLIIYQTKVSYLDNSD